MVREETERQHREQPRSGGRLAAAALPGRPTVVSPSDPSEHALEAFAQVVREPRLGQRGRQDRLRPHPPAARRRPRRADDSRTRYWNTGSWIYEPDLGSRQAYARYLRYAWPGTAVVIDDEEPEPRLVELLADLNPAAA